MKWSQFFNTSIGKKLLVGATGLFLCSFVIVHLAGNFQLLYNDEGKAFNAYAAFMGHNSLIQFIAWGLKIVILLHAFIALQLTFSNRAARPVKYAVNPGNQTSSWFSRQMAIMGSILLIFIVIHLVNFWGKFHYTEMPTRTYEGSIEPLKDLYALSYETFKNGWLVALYVIGMIGLSFHLIHGFKSACQTFGLNHKKYNGLLSFIGIWLFGIAIPIGFAIIPVVIYFK
ncbi:succinate dehydrogenase / fumarate reductase cytochrome b subunit [Chitinophaga ginsengisegetis]|uniref:Succinate dehydrogenase / fumarate reductase cytochrome b subunit n=1 Tax=Chitinophaga ginsengisegetis TaxID=393003 RepID=A0A1T5NZF7_9BACT|nr:succinate dehydrogenase cytochrome b subunit [Chitinophaga ginsengisegetis]MDR6567099.1 succinate dehydrogenase / fumarate reductase cytochrome b subunit [Chitinophaga ginsengisegetis]MDR6646829.1 succinate dehydrogenase / fumarate reductase cytochrome b subunit [Chitinophaga ginsengisegetis]MDR6653179.1 succinate dehydrogenase / fumarate reductase cytochrome b subunit [Chitinophaga ginsengisegetis]SKD05673.1 succinate dehydrogenase / fumarate reductase cytochrome b subunit [Chitinophaga gin